MTASAIPASPRVSVVMAVYNDLRFIDAAVESILAQTYGDFELIIVDDGTGQIDIFAELATRDARIRIIANERNTGPYAAANLAISQARGEIIARLDADDLAEPTRLARLLAALDRDPGLGLVGSWARFISESGETYHVWRTPEDDLEVRWTIHFCNPFCHSSVAFRRACFERVGGYNSTMRRSADYELWWRLLGVCRAQNIPEVLTRYRMNPRGITANKPPNWREQTDPVRRQCWERLGVEYQPQLVPQLAEFVSGAAISDPSMRERTYRTALDLLSRFLAAPGPMSREADAAAVRRLRSAIVRRVLTDRSIGLDGFRRLSPLCWRIDRAATLAAPVRWMIPPWPGRSQSA